MSAPGAPGAELDDTDRARAGMYALLARLYYGAPDAPLLDWIAQVGRDAAADGDTPPALAWAEIARVAAAGNPAATQQEYDDLFIGTGRAQVSVYATYYLVPTGREKLLAALREDLAALSLGRKEQAREPEDHFAGLFDVMRHLAARGSLPAPLEAQARFFDRYIRTSYTGFCAEVEQRPGYDFYRRLAALTRAFLDVESEALYMA